MAFDANLTVGVGIAGVVIGRTLTFTGTGHSGFDETIDADQTDVEVEWAVDVSALKLLVMVADQDVTIETNDGGSPVDTIDLIANEPHVWHTDSLYTKKLTTDVTSVFITTGAAATRIQCEALTDATPE